MRSELTYDDGPSLLGLVFPVGSYRCVTYIYIYIHIYIYVYIYIHSYIYIHIYIYTLDTYVDIHTCIIISLYLCPFSLSLSLSLSLFSALSLSLPLTVYIHIYIYIHGTPPGIVRFSFSNCHACFKQIHARKDTCQHCTLAALPGASGPRTWRALEFASARLQGKEELAPGSGAPWGGAAGWLRKPCASG